MAHRGKEPAAPSSRPVSGCPYVEATGAFVLGALSPCDLEDFVAHLQTCPRCDSEVGDLLAVVRVLDAVEPG